MSETLPPDSAERHAPTRIRYAVKIRRLTVSRTLRLSPSMIRVTLAGDDLAGFESRGHDDHVKLFFAAPGESEPVLPILGPDGPSFPEGRRPIARDYTPRRFDAALSELDLDFAIHDAGPATEWALSARAGDVLHVAGPRGSILAASDFDWYLLAGDETALPAMARRLEELPSDAEVFAFIEVGGEADTLELDAPAGARIEWVHRGDEPPGASSVLEDALAAFAPPPGEGHGWVACESDQAKRLRRILVERHGLPKRQVKASGYWKRGHASYHDRHED